MDTLGLKPDDFALYMEGLFTDHERLVTAFIRRLSDGKAMGELDNVISGQVTIERKRTPSRQCELTVADPDGSLSSLPPARSQLHKQYELEVIDSRYMPALGRWVDCRVFTGPINDVDPTGYSVRIQADGRDAIADGDAIKSKTWKRKVRKTVVIRDLLTMAGFRKLDIPNLAETMPTRISAKGGDPDKGKKKRTNIAPGSSRWNLARKVAKSIPKRSLYMNVYGVPVLQRDPKKPCLTLDAITSDVAIDANAEFTNYWHVKGPKPRKKKQKQVRASARLPRSHPRSGQSLAFNGEPRYEAQFDESNKAKTKKKAQAIVNDRRDSALKFSQSVAVDTVPIPNFEEGDIVKVPTPTGPHLIRMDTWTIPLDGSPMNIGAMQRLKFGKKR